MINNLYKKATELKNLNRNAEAIEFFLTLTEMEPGETIFFEELAMLYEKENSAQKAAECFEICLKRNFKPQTAAAKLMGIYFNAGNFEKAYELSKLASPPAALYIQGTVLKKLNKFDEAITAFEKLLELEPANMHAAEELGILHDAAKNFTRSEHFYNICLENNHNADEICFRLSAAFNAQNNFEKSKDYFLRINDKRKYLTPDFFYSVVRAAEHFTHYKQTLAAELIEALYHNAVFENITAREANALLNSAEIILGKTELLSYPKSLTIDVTGKCNFRCIMCDKKSTNHEISTAQKNEIKELVNFSSFVVWSGGEPFLYAHIMELIEAAYNAGNEQLINTNGSLLTEEIVKKLAEWNVRLAISIDAPDKETYELIRQGAKFETLTKNLEIVKKYRDLYPDFDTELHFVIQNENYKLLTQTLDFAAKYNFKRVVFTPNYIKMDNFITDYLKSGNAALYQKAKTLGIELQHWLAECAFGTAATRQQIGGKTKPLPKASEAQIEILKTEIEKLIAAKHALQNKELSCTLPWTSFFLMSMLETKPSCYCTVFEKDWQTYPTLAQMWNSPTFAAYRQTLLAGKSGLCSIGCTSNLIPDLNKKR